MIIFSCTFWPTHICSLLLTKNLVFLHEFEFPHLNMFLFMYKMYKQLARVLFVTKYGNLCCQSYTFSVHAEFRTSICQRISGLLYSRKIITGCFVSFSPFGYTIRIHYNDSSIHHFKQEQTGLPIKMVMY